jgi:hypothetical protein
MNFFRMNGLIGFGNSVFCSYRIVFIYSNLYICKKSFIINQELVEYEKKYGNGG